MSVLVLNAGYTPIGVVSWKAAVTLWYKKTAEILHSDGTRILHSGTNKDGEKIIMSEPTIIRLFHFVRPKKNLSIYKNLSRKNIYDRDDGRCQYCGEKISLSQFTIDHVLPRALGGKTTWSNVVCCCRDCNNKKGCKPLAETHMNLLKTPYAPLIASNFEMAVIEKFKSQDIKNKDWDQYINWNKEKVQK